MLATLGRIWTKILGFLADGRDDDRLWRQLMQAAASIDTVVLHHANVDGTPLVVIDNIAEPPPSSRLVIDGRSGLPVELVEFGEASQPVFAITWSFQQVDSRLLDLPTTR